MLMAEGKRLEEWNQTAEILAFLNNGFGGGSKRSYQFHPMGEEVAQAFFDTIELENTIEVNTGEEEQQ